MSYSFEASMSKKSSDILGTPISETSPEIQETMLDFLVRIHGFFLPFLLAEILKLVFFLIMEVPRKGEEKGHKMARTILVMHLHEVY